MVVTYLFTIDDLIAVHDQILGISKFTYPRTDSRFLTEDMEASLTNLALKKAGKVNERELDKL